MKMKKIITFVSAAALVLTSLTAVSVPSALADETAFFEDFEGYETVGGAYSLADTMNDLYADGWSVAGDNAFTARDENDDSQQFARVVKDGNNKVLELTTGSALGRMLLPDVEAPQGSYEISFKFKPQEAGSFDFSVNCFNGFANLAKHNIIYSDGVMRMGHRDNSISVPLTRVGTPENVWYDVKCVINNDPGYYSVELYKEGEFVARRGAINYDDDEKLGFLRIGANGSTVYVDDISIKPCETEMLIYEDGFDSYSEVVLPKTMLTVGATTTEASSMEGDSFFEGYTPWRALKLFGNYYDLQYDTKIESQVVRLGDDTKTTPQESTGMTFMALDGDLLTKDSQLKRGRLKLTFKFRHASNCNKTAIDLLSDYQLTNLKSTDYVAQMAIMGRPSTPSFYFPNAKFTAINTNWFDAEIIFDVINDEVTVIVREHDSVKEFAHFTHHTNWINTSAAPTAEKIKAINFRAAGGSTVYIDDVKLEYLITKPEITGSNIVMTDYTGEEFTQRKDVPLAIQRIYLPFGSAMTEDSTNPDTVTITDSKGKRVPYTPEYDLFSYSMIPDGFLTPGETYTLFIPGTVTNTYGRELGDDFEYSFQTTDKYPSLMTLNSLSVSDLADVKNGSSLTAGIDYANSSDEPISGLPFVAYYGDNMLLSTSSVKIDEIAAGDMGTKTVSFTVPAAAKLDMKKVDKISVCLWKGFENSAAYCSEKDIGSGSETASASVKAGKGSKPQITYSYKDSVLNISGAAKADSKYLTVQIIKPGKTFAECGELQPGEADKAVFYRAQVPVTDGEYSLDVRFDSKGNTESTLEAGDYQAAIYLDDTKIYSDSVYLSSYSDFEDVCAELNAAANSDNFDEFKNILNTKRSALNFNNELLGDADLGNEIKPYYEYVKKNPLNAANEKENSEAFNTYTVIQYLNGGKIENVTDQIDELLISDELKELCDEILTSKEKGKYFTDIVSGKDIDDPDELEKTINEALILTAAKYGNGYGELKAVLESCGDAIGIEKPISTAACKALIGKTYKDAKSLKSAYDKNADSSGGSGGTGGSSGGSYSAKKSAISSAELPVSNEGTGSEKPVPVSKTFNDIDNYEWAMTGILALADRSIIHGVSEDRFDPSRNITREEFVKILVGALGLSDYEYKGNIFSDASDGDWFVKYINIAADLGIVKGIGNGMFGVGYNITRQDMAVMLYNALQYRNTNMTAGAFKFDDDGEIADYAKEAVGALHEMGAVNGMTETTFVPYGLATRAQAAKIIYSVFKELQG